MIPQHNLQNLWFMFFYLFPMHCRRGTPKQANRQTGGKGTRFSLFSEAWCHLSLRRLFDPLLLLTSMAHGVVLLQMILMAALICSIIKLEDLRAWILH
jgi:hypothetical protein